MRGAVTSASPISRAASLFDEAPYEVGLSSVSTASLGARNLQLQSQPAARCVDREQIAEFVGRLGFSLIGTASRVRAVVASFKQKLTPTALC
ncbi:hypothetical protein EJ02DRAFT_459004 [Clathrospora elynae]|uniref:Uncharacterized protein n=1 Tax=Clathrospora elynae TaxID=706981 RepID=A0A6A5SI96_9PLEO|nr:hypothetical protein EJ02DRAFT_459004 [Clathrospora elynae]